VEEKYLMEEAVKYFKEEIYQIDIMLAGINKPYYVKYLNDKKAYYSLAIELIENLL
jgi:hypothetical protein